jgi:hypothetical protein
MKRAKFPIFIQLKIYMVSLFIGALLVIYFRLPEHWYFYALFFGIMIPLGRLIYFLFVGISIKDLEFMNHEKTLFEMKFRLGLSKLYKLKGEIQQDTNLTEKELKSLISKNTTRTHLQDALSYYADNVTLHYKYNQDNLSIRFFIK